MNKDMIELYSDYLIASFGQTTATGLANLLQGSIYHDSITRFLNSETYEIRISSNSKDINIDSNKGR